MLGYRLCQILFVILTLLGGFVLYLSFASPPPCIPTSKAGAPLEPPGTYDDEGATFGFIKFNFRALDWFNERLGWFKGATVFRCHPGLTAVALNDATSFRYLTSADTQTVERENVMAFGTASLPLRGPALPTCTAGGSDHDARRALFLNLFDQRGMNRLFEALQCATKDSVQEWQEHIRAGKTISWSTGINRLIAQMAAQWMFGTRLSDSDFDEIGPSVVLGVRGDQWLINFLGKLADKGEDRKVLDHVENILTLIRESPLWKEIVADTYRDFGVPSSDLELDFLCTLFINSIGAVFLSVQATLPFLVAHPEITKKIRAEMATLNEPITYDNIHKLEYLDAVAYEFQRAAPQPTIAWREAVRDFVVPTSSGLSYQIRKGERLVTHTLMAMYDKMIFGEDVDALKPHRFVKNPDLKPWVNFFFTATDPKDNKPKKNNYDCAAAYGPGAGAPPGQKPPRPEGDSKGGYSMATYKYLILIFSDLVEIEYDGKPEWSNSKMIQKEQPGYLSWIPGISFLNPLNIKNAYIRTHRGGTSGKWDIPHSVTGRGSLKVTVVGGHNFINKNALPDIMSVNSVVELQVWNQIKQTSTAIGRDPVWNEDITLNPYVFDGEFGDVLFIRVFHKKLYFIGSILDLFGKGDFLHQELGRGIVPLYKGNRIIGDHTIQLKEGGATVTVRIERADPTLQVR